MRDTPACKVCKGPRVPKLGLYCRSCYNRAVYIKTHGTDEGYEPRVMFVEGMPCSGCFTPITSENRFDRYTLCKVCGQKKATDRLRKWRGGQKRPTQRRPPSNPIVVAPKTHRAKGQAMPPPAPKAQPKPVPLTGPIPKGMTGRLPSSCPDLRRYCATETNPYWPSAKR